MTGELQMAGKHEHHPDVHRWQNRAGTGKKDTFSLGEKQEWERKGRRGESVLLTHSDLKAQDCIFTALQGAHSFCSKQECMMRTATADSFHCQARRSPEQQFHKHQT